MITPRRTVRIFSDLHLGDYSCRVGRLEQLLPLFDGADAIIFNGDSLDSRPGPAHFRPKKLAEFNAAAAARLSEFKDFLSHHAPPATLLTGNHDPDISGQHALDFANGQVFVTHGDVFFDDIVPWSRDVPIARRLLADELASSASIDLNQFDQRVAVFRRVCQRLPQRHHSEPNPFLYLFGLLADVAWPSRTLAVLRTWRETPALAAAVLNRHRPNAKFLVMGHTHRPGVARAPGGLTIINTGSFCLPAVPCAVDVDGLEITLRRIVGRNGLFLFGEPMANFALAPATAAPKILSSA